MLGYTPDPKDMIVTKSFNSNGKLTTQASARKGVQVIDSYLASGQGIQVGLNINGGTEDNINNATQHYVVINGTGTDSEGKYYHFADPYGNHGDNPANKLYLNSDGTLSGKSTYGTGKTFIVTEVRPE